MVFWGRPRRYIVLDENIFSAASTASRENTCAEYHLAVHGVVEVELVLARWRVHHAVLWISVTPFAGDAMHVRKMCPAYRRGHPICKNHGSDQVGVDQFAKM